jgi:hypothetical protein
MEKVYAEVGLIIFECRNLRSLFAHCGTINRLNQPCHIFDITYGDIPSEMKVAVYCGWAPVLRNSWGLNRRIPALHHLDVGKVISVGFWSDFATSLERLEVLRGLVVDLDHPFNLDSLQDHFTAVGSVREALRTLDAVTIIVDYVPLLDEPEVVDCMRGLLNDLSNLTFVRPPTDSDLSCDVGDQQGTPGIRTRRSTRQDPASHDQDQCLKLLGDDERLFLRRFEADTRGYWNLAEAAKQETLELARRISR